MKAESGFGSLENRRLKQKLMHGFKILAHEKIPIQSYFKDKLTFERHKNKSYRPFFVRALSEMLKVNEHFEFNMNQIETKCLSKNPSWILKRKLQRIQLTNKDHMIIYTDV